MSENTKSKVLVVDDEQANIMTLTHILRNDYTVYAEKNGRDALSTAIECKPDVILLDILMPEVDGYTVIAALKTNEETSAIPVIFITGLADISSEEKGLTLGAADYITKPFVPIITKLRVANQVKLQSQMRQLVQKELEVRKNKAKMEFLMDMSHETLTPMNVIMGMTQIAKMSDDRDEIEECLEEIDSASKQMLDMIMGLLDTADGKGEG